MLLAEHQGCNAVDGRHARCDVCKMVQRAARCSCQLNVPPVARTNVA